ncbi:hypothetical protein TcWFU_006528 [Taenia crassiceps]|uniref:Uncharacterized protein n=1 Tax=Taenia crassiceps TaxID=6207 RepID=A0ABR4Q8E2_9CEST
MVVQPPAHVEHTSVAAFPQAIRQYPPQGHSHIPLVALAAADTLTRPAYPQSTKYTLDSPALASSTKSSPTVKDEKPSVNKQTMTPLISSHLTFLLGLWKGAIVSEAAQVDMCVLVEVARETRVTRLHNAQRTTQRTTRVATPMRRKSDDIRHCSHRCGCTNSSIGSGKKVESKMARLVGFVGAPQVASYALPLMWLSLSFSSLIFALLIKIKGYDELWRLVMPNTTSSHKTLACDYETSWCFTLQAQVASWCLSFTVLVIRLSLTSPLACLTYSPPSQSHTHHNLNEPSHRGGGFIVSGGCARVAPIVKATCWKKEKKKKKKKEKSRRGGVGPAYATHLLAASVNTHSVNAISAHSISAYAHTTAHSDEVGSPPLHRTIALSPHRRRHSRGALCCALCVVKACHSCLTCHLYQHTHVNLRRLTDNRSLPQTKEKGSRHERIAEGIAIEGCS